MSLKIAKALVRLKNGEVLTGSSAKSKLIDELISEKIILQKGKHHKTLQLHNEEFLDNFLSNQLQIFDLEEYILALENSNTSRSKFVKISSDSKKSKERVFKGFLVNSYIPIKATLNGKEFLINPDNGSFVFIYDFETLKINKDITVVGIENSENFRHIEKQSYLFKNIKPLFISRYPQTQNKDFIKWMKSIPNNYLHFGDFDFAGIGIYLNEYKKHLGKRAEFYIPNDINETIKKGSRERYDIQKLNFKTDEIEENELLKLIEIIHKEKKGLDQEYYIKR
ncbi:MAG: hypothetical protein DSY76_03295 [Bacteroidetes bacterium]|nr:MAG: hypothetical protein DSY76_03295 [Bacteroidota bacterium]